MEHAPWMPNFQFLARSLPSMEGFCFAPPLPQGNSSLALYFWLRISDDLPWGSVWIFSGTA